MRSSRLLAVAVLAVVLALSSAQYAFGATELSYDNGTASSSDYFSAFTGGLAAVKFSLPTGWSSAKLLTAKYYILYYPQPFTVHIFDSGGVTELCCTPPLDVTPPPLPSTGWFSVDLSSYNIVVSGDFYVAIEWKTDSSPWLGVDTSSSAGRSYFKGLLGWEQLWGVNSQQPANLMVRAVVDVVTQPVPAPVGGFVESVNTFALLSPWLAVIGVVGCVSTVFVLAKKRRP